MVIQNQVRELVQILQVRPSLQLVTTRVTSLPEVMFENGLSIDAVDYYRGLNPELPDILNIEPYTVVNL